MADVVCLEEQQQQHRQISMPPTTLVYSDPAKRSIFVLRCAILLWTLLAGLLLTISFPLTKQQGTYRYFFGGWE